ncbi:MAG TPA: 1-acyl-sn-glycerol-3-phosphate acyltransferase [Flavobacteriales bacterium]|nr:1-acyl-sn-glycerol-3-phosphate acyltransferase [Flavobacteriales bacterium]
MDKETETGYFDPIRPFYDHEVSEAIDRLLQQASFHTALRYVFPDVSSEDVQLRLRSLKSVDEFQSKIISNAVAAIIRSSTSGVRSSGLDKLDPKKAYLFISNHRDIVLDSALLNYLLHMDEFPTTRIAIGSNLLQKSWIEDLVKLNKNFIVHRNVQARQAYDYSLRLSRYIRHSITKENSSVWIAQREGRSKDGYDQTQAGLLKMFGMSTDDGPAGYQELNIVPVSISYELEPCAGMKAFEKYTKAQTGSYEKGEGEDLKSMQMGIARPKGRVQFSFGEPLSKEEIQLAFETGNRNEAMKKMAERIDSHIVSNYRLYPYNYIAYDLLHESKEFVSNYSDKDKLAFESYLNEELLPLKGDAELLKKHLLNIYANPLVRKKEMKLI